MTARWPWQEPEHRSLSVLLVALTIVTGLVDAVSYLRFGHVFVANMTGNVVFLGFALAGASGVSASASLVALAAFLLGAVAGGRLAVAHGEHRAKHLRVAGCASLLALLASVAIAASVGTAVPEAARYALVVLLAIAMGIQNATARRLAVPDLTTTVLTLTLTGIAADSRLAGGEGGRTSRRGIAVVAMFAGALVGGLLVIHVDIVLPLSLAAATTALVAVLAGRVSVAE
jgi:uncharacterized membrane protein YoaK (UPF0700 family)